LHNPLPLSEFGIKTAGYTKL